MAKGGKDKTSLSRGASSGAMYAESGGRHGTRPDQIGGNDKGIENFRSNLIPRGVPEEVDGAQPYKNPKSGRGLAQRQNEAEQERFEHHAQNAAGRNQRRGFLHSQFRDDRSGQTYHGSQSSNDHRRSGTHNWNGDDDVGSNTNTRDRAPHAILPSMQESIGSEAEPCDPQHRTMERLQSSDGISDYATLMQTDEQDLRSYEHHRHILEVHRLQHRYEQDMNNMRRLNESLAGEVAFLNRQLANLLMEDQREK